MLNPSDESRVYNFFLNEATHDDLDFLSDWVHDDSNLGEFENYVKSYYAITTSMNEPDTDKLKRVLLEKMNRERKASRIRKIVLRAGYAAACALFIGLGYFFYFQSSHKETSVLPSETFVTITTDNGTVAELDSVSEKEFRYHDGNLLEKQKKSESEYSKLAASENIVYHTVSVPNGKKFDLILDDGTHVFLNSGTSLRYPVKFVADKRQVFLRGEAYFDVSKNRSKPFIVNADSLDITVLGTKFNVTHYPENNSINTVLVEGSVALSSHDLDEDRVLLRPDFMAEWDKANRTTIISGVDTDIYTGWLQGKLIFRNTSFREIRYALERKYGVTITNLNTDLDEQMFDATFDIERIEEVLDSFSKSYPFDYTRVEDEVTIR